jgi:hypothetical protein
MLTNIEALQKLAQQERVLAKVTQERDALRAALEKIADYVTHNHSIPTGAGLNIVGIVGGALAGGSH